ncbi:MAG TPA: site-specific DNA-methyltransferase [Verrucomicrobiae bacterium]|nr:site-specific DNA-methyltransferase [Verrucomicrobiae bacterium]
MLNLKLAANDATSEALLHLQEVNAHYREQPWPPPYDKTRQELRLSDARKLGWLARESVDLVVTSPPYFTLKEYVHTEGQMGDIADYESFLRELDKVWRQCYRVLKPGGRICCVVGDVCVPRKRGGRHYVLPLHSDIQVRARKIGFDVLTPILWSKIANGVTEAEGNGAGFYGKPYQPGAIVKNDIEYILFLRKGTQYRSPEPMQKALSMLTKDEMRGWLVSFWADIKGASTRDGHPAPYPVALAERLIKLFSFAGDTVLDPFVGTGSTILAAIETGRNGIGADIEPKYLEFADARIRKALSRARFTGATSITYERAIEE